VCVPAKGGPVSEHSTKNFFRCATLKSAPYFQPMNAVNWIKRRVSLSASSSPRLQSLASEDDQQQHSSSSEGINPGQQTHVNEVLTAATGGSASSLHRLSSAPRHMRITPGPGLVKHDIIDASSPLSLLAASSKLTTFPYGELQALNARMNIEAGKVNSATLNGMNGSHGINGVHPLGNGDVGRNKVPIAKSAPKQRLRATRERVVSGKVQSISKNLLPSALPAPIPAIPGPDIETIVISSPDASPSPAVRKPVRQRIVSTSALQGSRTVPISHKKSASLSSTQNTRSSKRLKTSHPTTLPPVTPSSLKSIPPPPKSKAPAAKSDPAAEPTGKKRILPVRQGHIDILDGEISLLSTPQRLDSKFHHALPNC